jgi:hypothetical protein
VAENYFSYLGRKSSSNFYSANFYIKTVGLHFSLQRQRCSYSAGVVTTMLAL